MFFFTCLFGFIDKHHLVLLPSLDHIASPGMIQAAMTELRICMATACSGFDDFYRQGFRTVIRQFILNPDHAFTPFSHAGRNQPPDGFVGKAGCFTIEVNRMNPVRQAQEVICFFITAV